MYKVFWQQAWHQKMTQPVCPTPISEVSRANHERKALLHKISLHDCGAVLQWSPHALKRIRQQVWQRPLQPP